MKKCISSFLALLIIFGTITVSSAATTCYNCGGPVSSSHSCCDYIGHD